MSNDSIVYQRSHAGREEIRNKSHGLTQSERLVLIMVDGVSSSAELRAKLPVLSNDRFDRAISKLSKNELILEVLLPVADQPRDEIEKSVIDRFLQQDPLDPHTILMLHADDDEDDWKMAPPVRRPPVTQSAPTTIPPLLDDAHIALAATVEQEVKALQQTRTPKLESIEFAAQTFFAQERAREQREQREQRHAWRVYLPYALMLTGAAFIAGFGLARIIG